RVEDSAKNTCLWFLKHDNFQKWMSQESGPLLVTADPGCGKSVLAKYLIDHKLPQSATICYFFFKDQDQTTCRQALCALLHQLFTQKPALIKHAMQQFDNDGQGLAKSTASLWKILRDATEDPEAGSVIMVLDALDECAELEFEDLMRNVESQFRDGHLGSKLKYLLTCRPYEQITSQFHSLITSFPDIRIPGEEESEAISQEVNHVITHRINQLSAQKNLTPEVKDHLTRRLQGITHRTYLWVYLIFKHLEEMSFRKTRRGIKSTIATLPNSINEAYERILSKTKERPTVQKALSILLAAHRPLTLAEMNIAVNLVKTAQNTYDLDLEDAESFKLRIRSQCGLFVAIHHDKVYFLHQTAREYLVAEFSSSSTTLVSLNWQHSITLRQAHATLAELCVIYLDFFNSNDKFVKLVEHINFQLPHKWCLKQVENARLNSGNTLDFLTYSARNWGEHFRKAYIDDNAAILPFTLRICSRGSYSHSLWSLLLAEEDAKLNFTECATQLGSASYLGLTSVAKLCLKMGCNIEAKNRCGETSLHLAAYGGQEEIAKMLLEEGADIDAASSDGETPLLKAVSQGYEKIATMLIEKGADIDAASSDGETPLLKAASEGYEKIVAMLIEKRAYINVVDDERFTPLRKAASNGHERTVKILRENGAELGPSPVSSETESDDDSEDSSDGASNASL
ncbi:hypothetical protein ACHAPE_010484, partial [Trichoderma viride]